jgi:excisionase family DNA binding protein
MGGTSTRRLHMGVKIAGDHPLLTPSEVARAFRVDEKTVNRWADAGRLGRVVRTPGNRRRFHRSQVEALLNGEEVGLR